MEGVTVSEPTVDNQIGGDLVDILGGVGSNDPQPSQAATTGPSGGTEFLDDLLGGPAPT